ncbi:hypothetical protein BCIN_08g00970 [Botrytis cinerea B05.10]|uniref:Fucose-specific lectin n=3 Tax=Botryotinia fuckeliana TaxID=40559 RepID=A0A384JPA8_BOTFB|nr:hypothetical protein BCIN_08g00970 [Botrytis cinerea B05.10]ATZ52350.1 hypothetical protein BCIN_08g00970 [Botrytis cinerea B05.10]EMR81548.1 hypothetical protein BcDW1_9881 [Botrytis cinerea BcDW1]CCD43786.1 hypothetical protein BofuT4_P010340.1 [Botrytis cinerea T4]
MLGDSLKHSDLEVFHGEIRVSDPGIQVKVETGIIPGGKHYELEVADSRLPTSDGDVSEITNRAELTSKNEIAQRKKWSAKDLYRRRKWFVIGGFMMLVSLIALASILGVVMKSRQQASASPSTTSSINEITSMVTLASPTVSTSTTISQSLSTAQGTVVATPSSNVIRNIAAVSYTSDFVNITKIYYSNNSGQLIEATTSNASLSTTPTWTKNMLNYTTNNGSAIAAAVSRPGLEPMEVTVVFVGSNNILNSISSSLNTSSSNADVGSWTSGSLSLQNISVYPGTRLSVLYNPCSTCDYNIIVSYQTSDGNLHIGNQTSSSSVAGTTTTSSSMSITTDTAKFMSIRNENADSWEIYDVYGAQLGTAVAFQNKTDKPDNRASLYWQWEGVNITAWDWYPRVSWSATSHWLSASNPQPYPPLTPIATGSTHRLVSNGNQAWQVILTLCSTGVRVDVTGGEASAWILVDGHPNEMSNSTGTGKLYKNIAVTDLGMAFVVTNNGTAGDSVEVWRLRDDFISWEGLGTMDLEGAWD